MLYPNIEAERVRRGLTRQQFAEAMGVSRKTVYNWLYKGKIPQSALLKMREFFGVSIEYLLQR